MELQAWIGDEKLTSYEVPEAGFLPDGALSWEENCKAREEYIKQQVIVFKGKLSRLCISKPVTIHFVIASKLGGPVKTRIHDRGRYDEAESKTISRPQAVYDNIKSGYGIADEFRKSINFYARSKTL